MFSGATFSMKLNSKQQKTCASGHSTFQNNLVTSFLVFHHKIISALLMVTLLVINFLNQEARVGISYIFSICEEGKCQKGLFDAREQEKVMLI